MPGAVEVDLRDVHMERPSVASSVLSEYVTPTYGCVTCQPRVAAGLASGRSGQDERGCGPDQHSVESSSSGPQIC